MTTFIWSIFCIIISISLTKAVRPTPFKGYLRGLTVPTTRLPCAAWDRYELERRREINRWIWEGDQEERQIQANAARIKAEREAAKKDAEWKVYLAKLRQKHLREKEQRKNDQEKAKQKAAREEAKRKLHLEEVKRKAERKEAQQKADREEAQRLARLKARVTVRPIAKSKKASLFHGIGYSEENEDQFMDFYDIIF